ncbi:MAG: hypothetical protein J5596_01405 [Bacteroidaceae bacterium]|nr:hypothetical protein [Bacteroidaceae bacterium]
MLKSELFRIRNNSLWFYWIYVLVAALLGVGCSHVSDGLIRGGRAIDAVMDKAESIMDNDAASADSLMNLIDSHSIRSKERLARYALLYTAAEYKNYQPVTSDSVIMMAVRHYSISNDMDYRFLSFYYLGCVYIELGQLTDAAVSLTQAEQLVDKINNKYWEGLLYYQLGEIFNKACDFHRAEEYYTMAKSCFELAGKNVHETYALYNIGDCKINMHEFKVADSITRIVEIEAIKINDSILYANCLYNRSYCTLYMNESDSATQLLDRYLSISKKPSNSFNYLELMALYYNTIKEYSLSESYLKKAWNCDMSSSDSLYLFYVSYLLAESKGRAKESLEYFQNYISLQNENLRAVLSQPILAAQKEQYRILAENELLKSRHAKTTLILCIVIFLHIIVIVLVTYHYKKKHMKEQLYDSLAVVEELSGKIEQLKNQVRVQFHERHDLSNRLYSMYFDFESHDKVTKQQLTVTINNLIKDYTAPDSVKKLDALINESYDGIMNRLSDEEIGLSDKEIQLLRFSFAGLSSKSVSVIIKESPQNIYQIKSRLLKKVKRNSEELWSTLNNIC